MHLVVERDVEKVLRTLVAHGRKRTQAHEERTISLEDDDAAIRLR